MKLISCLVVITLSLTSCQPTYIETASDPPSPTATRELIPSPTPEPIPSPTPTSEPIPSPSPSPTPEPAPSPASTTKSITGTSLSPGLYSDLDIESILIQAGDLPEGYSGGEVTDRVPRYIDFQGASCHPRFYQGIKYNDEDAGGVTLVFCAPGDARQLMFSIAYDMAWWGSAGSMASWEDKATIGYLDKKNGQGTGIDILFSRCDAVAHIRIKDITERDIIETYAKNLDERLSGLVCR